MNTTIRPLHETDIQDVVELSLLAWKPVFESWASILGPEVYSVAFPDWRKTQAEVVEGALKDGKHTVYVAEVGGRVAGFVAYELREAEKTGEIYLLAVHPEQQNAGIGAELNEFALQKMTESGMKLATVGTGGDPSHASARRAYEKAGFDASLSSVWYFKRLQ